MTITIRDAAEEDIPAIFEVRTSVRENHLSVEQMAEMGITNETIRRVLRKEPCIWVAVQGDHIVGFSMGDAANACLFAAFVRPEWEGQGIGRRLMERAEAFLFERHSSIWLHTDGTSRAVGFYERLGWKRMPDVENRDARFEKHRSQTSD
ncbi:GNAT family N-acetyltransferase [Pelagibacterium halotolerans]|uniref:GNAT family N-acetyltransferase n=1 Tax=Pelagibacterium halotolerans TaxID=531813 RepID=UPI00384B1314